jgi:hypothetical protein
MFVFSIGIHFDFSDRNVKDQWLTTRAVHSFPEIKLRSEFRQSNVPKQTAQNSKASNRPAPQATLASAPTLN